MNPLEEALARREVQEATRAQAQAVLTKFEAATRRVRDREDGWIPLLGAGTDGDEITAEDRMELLQRAREAHRSDPLIVGYWKSLMAYVVGEGVSISAATDDDQLNGRLDEWWGQFKRVNGWDKRVEEQIPERLWRDGEVFLRFTEQEVGGPPRGWEPTSKALARLRDLGATDEEIRPDRRVPAGMTHVRFVRPEHVRDPKGRISHGVVTSAQDVQTVLGYIVAPDATDAQGEFVPASDMLHEKIRVDAEVKRGRSLYEPLLKRNEQYEDWLNYRILLNLARTAVVLIKKMEGATAGEVSNIRSQQQDEVDHGSDRKQKMLKPLSTFHSSGIDYEFKSPNLDAQDAQKDGRSILLNMATATLLPEFMFSGDSSNANYSSTLVSEGPALKEFTNQRDTIATIYAEVWRRAMTTAAEQAQIEGLSPDQARDLEPALEWPTMEVRDEKAHHQAMQILFMNGVISRQTWQEDAGLDPDQEERRMEQERESDFNVTPPPADG